eukprot:scaffold228420_cov19-Prasinocladus_malaysianus.AAC.1
MPGWLKIMLASPFPFRLQKATLAFSCRAQPAGAQCSVTLPLHRVIRYPYPYITIFLLAAHLPYEYEYKREGNCRVPVRLKDCARAGLQSCSAT